MEKATETIRTPLSEFWRKFKKQKPAICAGVIIGILVLLAIIGPSIAPYPYDQPDYDVSLATPSFQHLMGTDVFGRDICSRIIIGARISLLVGFSSVTIGAIFGSILGEVF